jgi:predicted HTH transcriptional regulator
MKLQESFIYNPQQLRQLKSLVAKGEGAKLEFKRKASDPGKIVREMIAFANTTGGYLLVGVGDDGSIPGLKYPDGESFVIREAIRSVRPALPWVESVIPVDRVRAVLMYEISESKRKPHYLYVDRQRKEYFVRVADKSIKASRELREIIKRKQNKKDIRFRYGDHEKLLMTYLNENSTITLNKFMQVSGMKRFYASHKLVLLVLANVLHITPSEKEDIYTLAF